MGYVANNQPSHGKFDKIHLPFVGVRLRILLFVLLYLETGNIFRSKKVSNKYK